MSRFLKNSLVVAPGAAATVSVALALLALPPIGLWPGGLFALVPAFVALQRLSFIDAGRCGLVVGGAIGAAGYAGAAVMDVTTFVLASGCTALGMGGAFALMARVSRVAAPFAAPLAGAIWTCMELALDAQSLPFTLALVLVEAPALLQAAALGGQWLVVFLLVTWQFALAQALRSATHPALAAGWLLVAAGLTLTGSLHRMPAAGDVHVAAVQTRLHPFDYVHADADGHLEQLNAVRARLAGDVTTRADLVAWPEVPFAKFEVRGPDTRWPPLPQAQLVAGNDLGRDGRQYNAVFGVSADGQVVSRHVKSMLLPRLEARYAATESLAPHGDLPGAPGSLICFESAFPRVARRLTEAGAGYLVISTSDAFAGPSALPWLHAGFATLRAVENRRSVVRAANGGPSLLIGPDGHVHARIALFDEGVASATLPVMAGTTFFTRHAAAVRTLLLILLALAVVLALQQNEENELRRYRMRLGAFFPLGAACIYVAITAALASHSFARHNPDAPTWAGFGFTAHRGFDVDYADVSSRTEATDLDAAVAALLRQFGHAATRATVAGARAELARQSTFRVDAATLLDHFDLLHQPMSPAREHSDTPCVATLRDQSAVLVTRRSTQAVELFVPGQGAMITLPRSWLDQRATAMSRCVSGRAFPWDLERE